MSSERVVYRFPAPDPFKTRVEHVDVTDPAVFASKPYRLVRDGVRGGVALFGELNREQLRDLRDAIDRELERP